MALSVCAMQFDPDTYVGWRGLDELSEVSGALSSRPNLPEGKPTWKDSP